MQAGGAAEGKEAPGGAGSPMRDSARGPWGRDPTLRRTLHRPSHPGAPRFCRLTRTLLPSAAVERACPRARAGAGLPAQPRALQRVREAVSLQRRTSVTRARVTRPRGRSPVGSRPFSDRGLRGQRREAGWARGLRPRASARL